LTLTCQDRHNPHLLNRREASKQEGGNIETAIRDQPLRSVVLVVEDEPVIRMLAMDIVDEAGFQGIEAANADEAVRILEGRDDIRIVFADIDMPGSLDGMKLAACIRDRWPPIEIILTSGQFYPKQAELPDRAVFISKPYQISKVETVLKHLAR
jgi:CheY-like chemotaxis protein